VAELFAKVKANFGHADILVNNAAVNSGGGNIHEQDPDQWWLNYVRTRLLSQYRVNISALANQTFAPLGSQRQWRFSAFQELHQCPAIAIHPGNHCQSHHSRRVAGPSIHGGLQHQ
jgi:NAD(P)-dependent dehydrogenase (short-subunit alcohol dehydrogenase family)